MTFRTFRAFFDPSALTPREAALLDALLEHGTIPYYHDVGHLYLDALTTCVLGRDEKKLRALLAKRETSHG
jgi:hypothetical protein